MKICRFNNNRLGLVDLEKGVVYDVTRALEVLVAQSYPLPGYDLLIKELPRIKRAIRAELPTARKLPLHKVKLLAPVANPGKIIGAPINYHDHINEVSTNASLAHGRDMGSAAISKWGLFLKARSSLVGPSRGITLRQPFTEMENRNDHEVELVAVIGKKGTHISSADALGYVAGYCIGLDMTLRGPQFAGFRKSIDTYAVLGPWMVTADEFGDPGDVRLGLSVNGEPRQSASTRQLIYDVPRLIEFASSFYTLEPGDLIYTGTPAGVGPVKAGDTIVADVDGIGTMSVKVH
jgi:2,4-diketo-3-deoxy-L-fuconate hydrolase